MKKIRALFLFIIMFQGINQLVNAQTELKLERKKATHLRKNAESSFYILSNSKETSIDTFQLYFGKVMSYNDSIITIKATGYNENYEYRSGKTILTQIGFKPDTLINLSISKIERIETYRNWFIVPAVIGYVSLASAIVAAPLIAANFKANSFDTQEYKNILGISLLTSVVCLNVSYTIGRKNYYLNCPNKREKCKLWKVTL